MNNQQKERWIELAEQASTEQEPQKLLKILEEINRALDKRRQELREQNKQ
jgi:hypothetical protein